MIIRTAPSACPRTASFALRAPATTARQRWTTAFLTILSLVLTQAAHAQLTVTNVTRPLDQSITACEPTDQIDAFTVRRRRHFPIMGEHDELKWPLRSHISF